MDVEQLDQALLFGSAVVLVAILAVRVSSKAGLPSLLLYLALGMMLGTAGLGFEFDDAALAHALGFGALVVILTEGGLTTRWTDIKPVVRTGALLATLGTTISISVMTVLAHYVFGFDWQLAVLLGAITAPTDAAAVFSVLRRVPLPRRLTGALEAESGLNDAPTVVIVTLVSQGDLFTYGPAVFAGIVIAELIGGVVVGVLLGRLGARFMKRAALPSSGLYPLAVFTICVLTYSGASALHASGFAAVYTAALILGNAELPHRAATRSFAEGMGWLSQIGLFVMLGLLLRPSTITVDDVFIAFALGVVLTVVARPLAVLASCASQRMALAEMTFISWAGLRGAVPIVLATIPLSEQVEGSTRLFTIVFILVVIDTVVTAPTLPWVAARLGVMDTGRTRDLDIEAAPLERVAADFLQVRVTRRSQMHGVEVGELRLPPGASVALIVRDGQTKIASGHSVLRHGDELLVVTPRKARAETEARLRVVSERGRLANWLD